MGRYLRTGEGWLGFTELYLGMFKDNLMFLEEVLPHTSFK